jgi:hypothetical protein
VEYLAASTTKNAHVRCTLSTVIVV